MKIRTILTTPDRRRFVCFFLGHDWQPDAAYAPVSGSRRFVCRRCLAIGEAS